MFLQVPRVTEGTSICWFHFPSGSFQCRQTALLPFHVLLREPYKLLSWPVVYSLQRSLQKSPNAFLVSCWCEVDQSVISPALPLFINASSVENFLWVSEDSLCIVKVPAKACGVKCIAGVQCRIVMVVFSRVHDPQRTQEDFMCDWTRLQVTDDLFSSLMSSTLQLYIWFSVLMLKRFLVGVQFVWSRASNSSSSCLIAASWNCFLVYY